VRNRDALSKKMGRKREKYLVMWGYFVSVREKTFRYRRGSFLQKELVFKEAVYESSFHFHARNLVAYPVIFLETEILMTIHYVHCSGTWDSTKTLSRENNFHHSVFSCGVTRQTSH